MKTINNIISRIVKAGMFLTLACFTACQDYSIDSQPELDAKLECDALEQYNVTCTAPDQVIFNVSSNSPWKISVSTTSEDQSWCTVNPGTSSSSSLISEVTVSFKDNKNAEPREAVLTISAENVEETVVVKVVQEAYGNLIIADAIELATKFATEGGSKKFRLRSNKDWEIVCEDTWIDFEPKYGEGSDTEIEVTVNCAANEGGLRDGSFYVKTSEQQTNAVPVYQDGLVLTFEITDEERAKATNLPSEGVTGHAIAVNINAVTYTASTDTPWIKNITVDNATGIFTFDVDANMYLYSRKGQITLTASDPSFDDIIIDVTQMYSSNFNLWGKSDKNDLDAPEGMFTEKGLKLTAADNMRVALPGAFTNGKLVIEFDEVTEVAVDKEFVICGASDYDPSKKPNTHILFGDANNNFNGANDWRVNGVYGWSTFQNNPILRNEYTKIRTIEVIPTNTSISLIAKDAEGAELVNKVFNVNANWSEGTFSYFLYFNGNGDASSYCVIKSFYFIPEAE